jgi:hypothetical protein
VPGTVVGAFDTEIGSTDTGTEAKCIRELSLQCMKAGLRIVVHCRIVIIGRVKDLNLLC